jgi:hypothetical protein
MPKREGRPLTGVSTIFDREPHSDLANEQACFLNINDINDISFLDRLAGWLSLLFYSVSANAYYMVISLTLWQKETDKRDLLQGCQYIYWKWNTPLNGRPSRTTIYWRVLQFLAESRIVTRLDNKQASILNMNDINDI